jgi:2,4-dienoyl-CoA reductase (NADPH2)
MKAACTAAERGHEVVLVEETGQLGGQLLLNRRIPGRKEMVTAATDLENNLKALGVKVLLGCRADAEFVTSFAPAAVVLATGATPLSPDIAGIKNENVFPAWEVLKGKVHVGREVVVIGGNAVGLETALYLAHQGTISPEVLHFLVANRAESWDQLEHLVDRGNKNITVLEMAKKAGQDIGASTRWTVLAELRRLGVTLMTSARAVELGPDGVTFEKEAQRDQVPADTVILATGSKPEIAVLDEISDVAPEVLLIGDAREPRDALEAIREGFLTALKI